MCFALAKRVNISTLKLKTTYETDFLSVSYIVFSIKMGSCPNMNL